jgi:hypothetical protein
MLCIHAPLGPFSPHQQAKSHDWTSNPTKASQLMSLTVSLNNGGNRCRELRLQPITSNQIDDLGVVGLRHPIAVNLEEEMANKHKISQGSFGHIKKKHIIKKKQRKKEVMVLMVYWFGLTTKSINSRRLFPLMKLN